MARLPYLSTEDLAEADRGLLRRNINLHRALVHSPAATRAFSGLGTYIRHGSTLDARLRELAILQVGWVARSPYEWSHHIKIGHEFGVSDADIHGLIADTAGQPSALEPLAKRVLCAAREMAEGPGMTEASFTALGQALSREHLMDLTLTIGFYCAVVRVLATLEIDVEPDYQPYLDAFPFPD
jgi:alkylhydroperoxidase family enzyme